MNTQTATPLSPPPPSAPRSQRLATQILWWEPLWVLLLAPLILLPGRFAPGDWQPWLVISLALFWPLRLLIKRQLLPSTPLNWPLTLILLWLPINIWASAAPAQSWEGVGYLALGIALFVATVNWPPTQRRPELILWPALAMSLALALLGPALMTSATTSMPLPDVYQSAIQPLVQQLEESINPNILAGVLLIFIPIWMALALRPDWTRHRWISLLFGLVAVGMVGVIVLTGSRASLLALGVVLPLMVALRWPKLWPGLVLMLFGATFALFMSDFHALLNGLTASGTVPGLDVRLEIWRRALYALHDFPFTGIGIGTFNRVIPLLYPYFLTPPSVDILHAHNLLLQIGIDLGLPGLIAYLAIIINLFTMLISLLRRQPTSLQWAITAGIFGALVATLIGGIFDAVNWGSKPAFLPWLLIAMTVLLHRALYLQRREFNEQEDTP